MFSMKTDAASYMGLVAEGMRSVCQELEWGPQRSRNVESARVQVIMILGSGSKGVRLIVRMWCWKERGGVGGSSARRIDCLSAFQRALPKKVHGW